MLSKHSDRLDVYFKAQATAAGMGDLVSDGAESGDDGMGDIVVTGDIHLGSDAPPNALAAIMGKGEQPRQPGPAPSQPKPLPSVASQLAKGAIVAALAAGTFGAGGAAINWMNQNEKPETELRLLPPVVDNGTNGGGSIIDE